MKLTILSKEHAQDSEFRSVFLGKIEETMICFCDLLPFYTYRIKYELHFSVYLFRTPLSTLQQNQWRISFRDFKPKPKITKKTTQILDIKLLKILNSSTNQHSSSTNQLILTRKLTVNFKKQKLSYCKKEKEITAKNTNPHLLT